LTNLLLLPEWLGAAMIGAVLAAFGYLAKSGIELWIAARQRDDARRAALVELHSLLRAAGVTFKIQNQHARDLSEMVIRNHADVVRDARGFEETLTKAYPRFDEDAKELHSLIRSMTTTVLRPTNLALLEWLRKDTFHKAQPAGKSHGLSRYLSQLEAHLILWHAKYEAWIPEHPEHALVYLDDEKKHGLGFPFGIDAIVSKVTGLPEPESDSLIVER
jgi:hypothetical protein